MCWIIPLTVGIISAILGYLLSKSSCDCENSPLFINLRKENEELRHKLGDCEANKKLLLEETELLKASLADKGTVKEKVKGKVKEIVNHFAGVDKAEEDDSITGSEAINHFAAAASDKEAEVVAFDADLAKSVFGKKIKQDDLTVVEGIGPKIAGLFQDAEIKTWQALADTSVERCKEILTDGGPRFAIHTPDTWPRQAKLAAAGKWQELFDCQEKLEGGVEV